VATIRTWDHSFACGIHDDQPCTCKEDSPMSGATYRIDVEHRPDPGSSAGIDWIARITRLSDDKQVTSVWGNTAEHAIAKARGWLFAQSEQEMGRHLFVNDAGEDEMPQGVTS
jgi:glutamine synthetase adenylyltransferase